MIRLGDCADCSRVELKAVVCEMKYAYFPYEKDVWQKQYVDQSWDFVSRNGRTLERTYKIGTLPTATYTINPHTGAVTNSNPSYPADYGGLSQHFIFSEGAPYLDEVERGLEAVDSVDFDDVPWNSGVLFKLDYGVMTRLDGPTAGAYVATTSLRKFSAGKSFSLIRKFQLRVDGKYCLTFRDSTADVRTPGSTNWGPGSIVPPAEPGYTEGALFKLKDCREDQIVTAEVPDFWGTRDAYIEPCYTCPPAAGAVSPPICYPAP